VLNTEFKRSCNKGLLQEDKMLSIPPLSWYQEVAKFFKFIFRKNARIIAAMRLCHRDAFLLKLI